MAETAEGENTKKKGLMLFGNDLLKVECMRGSLLNGYIGAIVGGLGGFMYTSNLKVACHSGFGSYWIVAFASWIMCRYRKYQRDKNWEHSMKALSKTQIREDEYHLPRTFELKTMIEEESRNDS